MSQKVDRRTALTLVEGKPRIGHSRIIASGEFQVEIDPDEPVTVVAASKAPGFAIPADPAIIKADLNEAKDILREMVSTREPSTPRERELFNRAYKLLGE